MISQAFRDRIKAGLKNGFTGGGGAGKYMKWDKGQKRVTRMVPRADPSKDPVVCGEVHYNLADGPTPCPGRGCPVNKALWDIKEDGRADASDLFKSYGAKPQAAWLAIDRNDPERRPQIVSKGFSVKKKNGAADQMMGMFVDETNPEVSLDPSDPENGFDVVMELGGDGTGYTLKAARTNTPLAATKEERDEIITKADALSLDTEFVCTPEHLKILEEAAVKIRNGTLKAESKWGNKAATDGQPQGAPIDTLAMVEAPAGASVTTPPAAPESPPAAPPAASGAKAMADRIRERAQSAGKAA